MDLIYIILSVLLRVSPAVRKISVGNGSHSRRRHEPVDLAIWFPLVGWISVSVQHVSEARWLPWRVRGVHSFGESALNLKQKKRRNVAFKRRGRDLPPRFELPD